MSSLPSLSFLRLHDRLPDVCPLVGAMWQDPASQVMPVDDDAGPLRVMYDGEECSICTAPLIGGDLSALGPPISVCPVRNSDGTPATPNDIRTAALSSIAETQRADVKCQRTGRLKQYEPTHLVGGHVVHWACMYRLFASTVQNATDYAKCPMCRYTSGFRPNKDQLEKLSVELPALRYNNDSVVSINLIMRSSGLQLSMPAPNTATITDQVTIEFVVPKLQDTDLFSSFAKYFVADGLVETDRGNHYNGVHELVEIDRGSAAPIRISASNMPSDLDFQSVLTSSDFQSVLTYLKELYDVSPTIRNQAAIENTKQSLRDELSRKGMEIMYEACEQQDISDFLNDTASLTEFYYTLEGRSTEDQTLRLGWNFYNLPNSVYVKMKAGVSRPLVTRQRYGVHDMMTSVVASFGSVLDKMLHNGGYRKEPDYYTFAKYDLGIDNTSESHNANLHYTCQYTYKVERARDE